MALTRVIQLSFWTDSKIVDDFTPEDRYFYLYLMTNPHTNVCGCYEISTKQMSDETGYSKETIEKLINRMMGLHKVVAYNHQTKEMLLINWSKYNWTRSDKLKMAVEREIMTVKDSQFRDFLTDLYNEVDTVSIRYPYGMDTSFSLNSNTNTKSKAKSNINTINIINNHYFDDEDINNLFVEFLEQRKKLKAVNSDLAIQRLKNKIDEYSSGDRETALAIIGESIDNSWKGIFPLKGPKKMTTAQDREAYLQKWRDA